MKVLFETADVKEVEVTIKGEIGNPDVEALLEFIKSRNTSAGKKLMLYKEDVQFLINPEEVIYIEASGNKVRVVTSDDVFDSKKKLYELYDFLANEPFAQINKGTLVNIDFVKSVQAEFSGNYSLRLKQSKEILTVSRKYFKEFKSKI